MYLVQKQLFIQCWLKQGFHLKQIHLPHTGGAAQGTKILINSNYRNALELHSVFLTQFSDKK